MSKDIIPLTEKEIAVSLTENVEKMGTYLLQMADLLRMTKQRLDKLEENIHASSVNHEDTLVIKRQIRQRAAEYCEKYKLIGRKDRQTIASAIKKSILLKYGIKDLHDCPQIALSAIAVQIEHWTDIRLVMKIRDKYGEDGA